MNEPNDLMPPDDRDPWQEMSEKERAEYEAWSKMVDEKNGEVRARARRAKRPPRPWC